MTTFGAALQGLWPILADAAIKGTVLLLLAWGATRLLARASAALRHLTWTLVVAGLLALPVLASVLPQWQVLPRIGQDSQGAQPGGADLPVRDNVASDAHAIADEQGGEVRAQANGSAAGVARQAPAAEAAVPIMRRFSWERLSPYAMALWLLGVIVTVAPMIAGRVALWRLRRQCIRRGYTIRHSRESANPEHPVSPDNPVSRRMMPPDETPGCVPQSWVTLLPAVRHSLRLCRSVRLLPARPTVCPWPGAHSAHASSCPMSRLGQTNTAAPYCCTNWRTSNAGTT